ncbi:TetR/AcrR family transcriptional regulator [Nocardia sp. IBHARD005]|uniref:TetR/AcrR family transcriptional regulator n=1 Tax=Nocardia sp. IBHARD005 TaxID=3457765 RepID=UPI00405968E4
MPQQAPTPSTRQTELLEAAYQYALDHGLTDLSLRPLAQAIGSSPRVLLFLFKSKDGLVRALLARARAEELAFLDRARQPDRPAGLVPAVEGVWAWLAAKEHRPLLRLWAEAYARSLVQPDGVWAGFARATVEDWLGVLAGCQPQAERDSEDGAARRTLALAVLRGALLDLLATDDEKRITAAVAHQLALLRD